MNETNSSDGDILYDIEQRYGRTFDVHGNRELAAMSPALRRLLRAGYITRMSRGVYTIAARQELVIDDPLRAATAPFADIPHYVSWRAALSRHGLTEMDPLTISVALRCRRPKRKVSDLTVRPVYQSADRFYGFAATPTPYGSSVFVATPEKAIIDSLDRPDLAGGLAETVKALGRTHAYDAATLVTTALRFPSAATAARLGFLMTALGIGNPTPLRGRVRSHSAPVVLDLEDQGSASPIDQTWRVADNVGTDILTQWASR